MKQLAESFAENLIQKMKGDPRFLGLALAGSFAMGADDDFSDLDLIIVCTDKHYAAMLEHMTAFATLLGNLGASYVVSEHGRSNLLACLYTEPTLHVDLKFVMLKDFSVDNTNLKILWQWNGALSAAVSRKKPAGPDLTLQYVEDRFWIWLQEAAAKLGRGELFYACDLCAELRSKGLVPLLLKRENRSGARLLESKIGSHTHSLAACVPYYDSQSVLTALIKICEFYFALRYEMADEHFLRREEAEDAACNYLNDVKSRLEAHA